MNGYRTRNISQSSSSDEDLQSLNKKHINKDDIYACQVVTCEFCDEAFWNRYNYLVHNANHIIIPLLRKSFFKCDECQLQCRTGKKLRKHMKKHHHNKTSHLKKQKDRLDSMESLIVTNNSSEELKYSKKVFEIMPVIERETKHSVSENVLVESVLANSNSNIGVEIIEIVSDDDDTTKVECKSKKESSPINERQRIQNRLVFENEEDYSKGLLHDLMADIKVSVDLEPWMTTIADVKNEDAVPEVEDTQGRFEKEWQSKTVGYQELIESEDIACRYCKKLHPNRLSAIIHETTHMTTKKRHPFVCQFCDWYVAGDPHGLRKHHTRSHPDREVKLNIPRKHCTICNLKYISKDKHMKNYHPVNNNNDQERKKEVPKQDFLRRIIKICDLCSSFLKNIPNNVYYKQKGEESVSGVRQTCERCFKQYFTINLVEITSRHKFLSHEKRIKSVSNMDRLKNFKNRLKLMNTIRKYFFWFHFSI